MPLPAFWGALAQRCKRQKRKQPQLRSQAIQRAREKHQAKRVCTIGTWNTRQMGATKGRTDQVLKFQHMSCLWERRGWEIVILTDSKWGRHEQFTIQGKPTHLDGDQQGQGLALNDKWRQSWQVGAIPASTDGKGAECRVMLLQLPCYKRMGIAVMAVYAPSSTGSVDDLSEHLEPGILWRYRVDGQLQKRGSAKQATRDTWETVLGDIEFADDTATIATETEFAAADQILEQTFQDWGEKINRKKTETLRLKPGAQPDKRQADASQVHSVRHVGGHLTEAATQWTDTIQRCVQARRRAKEIAKAWSTGTKQGRGEGSRVRIATRLRVMRSTFGRSRPWTKAQVAAAQAVQNYAIQRCFGLDRLAMREQHTHSEQLHHAARWPTVEQVLMRNTLKWVGHVARMPPDRLPKIALWGQWAEGGNRGSHATLHTQWIKQALQQAEIHEMDWFRLAQNADATQWASLLNKAFPTTPLSKTDRNRLNEWRPGQPIPTHPDPRRRPVWNKPASAVSTNECPACGLLCSDPQESRRHYTAEHAVIGHQTTTIQAHQCTECFRQFPSANALAKHECRRITDVPGGTEVDAQGWRPLDLPQLEAVPAKWKIYTDGSGGENGGSVAGWGFAVYDDHDANEAHPLFHVYGPVVTDESDQRWLGAQKHSNNTAELTAIAEALTWLQTEAPGPEHVPVSIRYDSQYAANAVQGATQAQANRQLVEKCREIHVKVQARRAIDWTWVKGHAQVAGNEMADKLADKGSRGEIGTHSRRWAAPHRLALTRESAEKCRGCGRLSTARVGAPRTRKDARSATMWTRRTLAGNAGTQ